MEKQRILVLETLFAAFNRHDADGVMACFAPNIVFDAAAGPFAFGKRMIGQEAVRAAFISTWTSMPDVKWHVHRHSVFGDRALSEWLFTATAPSGEIIEVEGIDLFSFSGDLLSTKSAFRKDRPAQPSLKTSGRE